MSLLKNTLPAERARGCKWADRFTSIPDIIKNGGTISGTPTIQAGGGIVLNGTTDFVQYSLAGNEFDSDEISIVVEFTPDFDWDEDVLYFLFDTSAASSYRVFKHDNANNNILSVKLGGTTIADIASVAYSSFWLQDQRNVLLISGTSSATNAWLNGNQILTNDGTAWTHGEPTELYLGSNAAEKTFFDGTIHSFKVFHALLTQAEAQAYYDNSMFNYMNRAIATYQMRVADHDPTNNRTLDSSGNGNHLTLGDGAGAGEPTKLTTEGYELDGVNDYFSDFPSGWQDCLYVWDGPGMTEVNSGGITGPLSNSGDYAGKIKHISLFPFVLNRIQRLDFARRFLADRTNVEGMGLLINDQSTLQTTTIKIMANAGAVLEILWGDDLTSTVTCNGVLNTYTHDYAATGNYTISIRGNYKAITQWQSFSQAFLSGDIAAFSPLTSLTKLVLYSTSVGGDIADLATLTSLSSLVLYNTSVSGDIADLATLTSLSSLNLYNTSVSGDIADLATLTSLSSLNLVNTSVSGDIADLATLTNLTYLHLYSNTLSYTGGAALPAWAGCDIRIYSCGLTNVNPTWMVDNFLIDLANGVGAGGTLNIAGTNGTRTVASDAAKAALIAAGWGVTVNE